MFCVVNKISDAVPEPCPRCANIPPKGSLRAGAKEEEGCPLSGNSRELKGVITRRRALDFSTPHNVESGLFPFLWAALFAGGNPFSSGAADRKLKFPSERVFPTGRIPFGHACVSFLLTSPF